MKRRNIYKDIVVLAVFCLLVSVLTGWGREYAKEQKTYGVYIRAEKDLTENLVEELRKLSGICRFEPVDTANVTIRLGCYTMEAEVMGLDLKEETLNWDMVQPQIAMGNTPALFFGKEMFASFTDRNGYPPLKSQVEKWIEQYDTLDLTVIDENGRERKAKICGILKEPEERICMEKNQMREIFGDAAHIKGGVLEIYGYKNLEKAREVLEGVGVGVGEWVDSEIGI